MKAEQDDIKRQELVKVSSLVEFIIYLLFALGPLTGNVIPVSYTHLTLPTSDLV